MTNSKDSDSLAESDKIELFLSDDEKIKSVGELLTNNSSRNILQLLFTDELSANEITQKTDISLQLVKYHLNKMQEVGMVKVSKTEKNSKGHDMKYYKATKFAIVILPSKVSDRAKESKALIRSFKTIYKFVGVGVAAVAGLFSLSLLQKEPELVEDLPPSSGSSSNPSSSPYMGNIGEQTESGSGSLEESLQLANRRIEAAESNPSSGSGMPYFDGGDLIVVLIIIGIIMGGLAAYFFWRAYRHSKSHKEPSQT